MTGGSEDFQIIDSGQYRSDDRLDRLREIYQNETCKSAIDRTRRAESNAKALEAILEANMDTSEESNSAPNGSMEDLFMELEDTRSRLVSRLKELESLRSQVSELKSQQSIDNENIESLQGSLERLHRVAGEYRTDRDKLSLQLIDFFNTVKNSTTDYTNVSMEELKEQLGSGALIITDPSLIGTAVEDKSELVAELEALIAARDAAIVEKQAQISELEASVANLQTTINKLVRQVDELKVSNESLNSELVQERSAIAEYETKINEWSEWAGTVTADLEARNKEIELLEKFKEHAAEEIEILEERVKELSMATPPPVPTVDSSELTKLTSRIDELALEKSDLEKKIYEWSEWAESMTTNLDSREKEIDDLKQQLMSEESDARAKLETLLAEKLEISSELEAVKESVADLTLQINAKEDEISSLTSVQDDLKRAEAKIANLNDQLLISENLASGAAEQLETQRASLENLCGELRAKLAVRDATISALSKRVDDIPVIQKTDNSAEYMERIRSLEAELVGLREQQFVSGERENEIHRLRGEIAFLNEEIERTTSRIADLESSYEQLEEELEATRVELRNKKSFIEALENQKSEETSFEDRVKLIEEEKSELAREIDRLQGQVDTQNTRQTELLDQVSEMTKKLNEWTIWSEDSQRELSAKDAELVQLRLQLDESAVVADRLREQIRMLEEGIGGGTDAGSPDLVRLETERADMEQKLIAWNKWADEVTAQLAERDATIADLMSGRDHLDESLRQAEELRRRVAELESTAVEREKNLADDSPIGRRLENHENELEKAQAEIDDLRAQLEKAQVPRSNSPGVVSSEEAEVLLEAYRAEIDRLSKENSRLRTEARKSSTSGSDSKPTTTTASANSWWNILPDIEETDDAQQ